MDNNVGKKPDAELLDTNVESVSQSEYSSSAGVGIGFPIDASASSEENDFVVANKTTVLSNIAIVFNIISSICPIALFILALFVRTYNGLSMCVLGFLIFAIVFIIGLAFSIASLRKLPKNNSLRHSVKASLFTSIGFIGVLTTIFIILLI